MPITEAFNQYVRNVLNADPNDNQVPARPTIQGESGETLSLRVQPFENGPHRRLILTIQNSPMSPDGQPMYSAVELYDRRLNEVGARYMEVIEHQVRQLVQQYEHRLDRWWLDNPLTGHLDLGTQLGMEHTLREVEGDEENRKFRIERNRPRRNPEQFFEFIWSRERCRAQGSGVRLKRMLGEKALDVITLLGIGKIQWEDIPDALQVNQYHDAMDLIDRGAVTPQEALRRLHVHHEQIGALRPHDAYVHNDDVEIRRNREWLDANYLNGYGNRVQGGPRRG